MVYIIVAILVVIGITVFLLTREITEVTPERMVPVAEPPPENPLRNVLTSWLEGTAGPISGKSFQLGQRSATIGRSPNSFIQILDDDVSRDHAILKYNGGVLKLIDLQSANGCYINGEQVTEAIVKDNDRIAIGGAEFIYHELAAFSDDSARERKVLGRTTNEVTKQEDFTEAAAQVAEIYAETGQDMAQTVAKSGLPEGQVRALLKSNENN
jgi:hypothetical protein